jgi:hypothetical protein
MNKILMCLIAAVIMAAPQMQLEARHGDAALAAGLIGTAVITSAVVSNSGSRARHAEYEAKRAQDEARMAQDKAESIRTEQQKEKLYDLQRQIERQSSVQESGKIINILIFAVVMLFLGIISLAVIILKKK